MPGGTTGMKGEKMSILTDVPGTRIEYVVFSKPAGRAYCSKHAPEGSERIETDKWAGVEDWGTCDHCGAALPEKIVLAARGAVEYPRCKIF